MMPKVFISHSSNDRDFVEATLLPILKDIGVDTWYSGDDIHTGDRWERTIHSALQSCDWFLVVISVASRDSPWVHREVSWAEKHRQYRIVPLLIDDSDPAELHLALSTIQHIDFFAHPDEARLRLTSVWTDAQPEDGRQEERVHKSRIDWDIENLQNAEHYRQRADSGDIDAQLSLGVCYERGIGIPKDLAAAIVWYERAAAGGHTEAQYTLGYYYQEGVGKTKDPKKAFEYFHTAAERGHPNAQNSLGWCYEKGFGVETSFVEALRWYKASADQGLSQAQYNIGEIYYLGEGVARDDQEAKHWLQLAARNGHDKARSLLKKISEEGQEMKGPLLPSASMRCEARVHESGPTRSYSPSTNCPPPNAERPSRSTLITVLGCLCTLALLFGLATGVVQLIRWILR